jgi:hypothetical protein
MSGVKGWPVGLRAGLRLSRWAVPDLEVQIYKSSQPMIDQLGDTVSHGVCQWGVKSNFGADLRQSPAGTVGNFRPSRGSGWRHPDRRQSAAPAQRHPGEVKTPAQGGKTPSPFHPAASPLWQDAIPGFPSRCPRAHCAASPVVCHKITLIACTAQLEQCTLGGNDSKAL